MSKVIEDILLEGIRRQSLKTAKMMLDAGTFSVKEIAKYSSLPKDEVEKLKEENNLKAV